MPNIPSGQDALSAIRKEMDKTWSRIESDLEAQGSGRKFSEAEKTRCLIAFSAGNIAALKPKLTGERSIDLLEAEIKDMSLAASKHNVHPEYDPEHRSTSIADSISSSVSADIRG